MIRRAPPDDEPPTVDVVDSEAHVEQVSTCPGFEVGPRVVMRRPVARLGCGV